MTELQQMLQFKVVIFGNSSKDEYLDGLFGKDVTETVNCRFYAPKFDFKEKQ